MFRRWLTTFIATLALAAPAGADISYFSFPLIPGDPALSRNPKYTSKGITLTCSTDSVSTAPYDKIPNPEGALATIYDSYDTGDGPLNGSLRLTDYAIGGPPTAVVAAWMTFSVDVYQIDFYGFDLSGTYPLRVEAYDPDGNLVAVVSTQKASPYPSPEYEHLEIRGDKAIHRLRLLGLVNEVSFDALTVWTDGVSPAHPATWGEVKTRWGAGSARAGD